MECSAFLFVVKLLFLLITCHFNWLNTFRLKPRNVKNKITDYIELVKYWIFYILISYHLFSKTQFHMWVKRDLRSVLKEFWSSYNMVWFFHHGSTLCHSYGALFSLHCWLFRTTRCILIHFLSNFFVGSCS